jgi:arylsulfatase
MKTLALISTMILTTLLWAFPSMAQQFYGTPGSPGAKTTIDGRNLPPPPHEFKS